LPKRHWIGTQRVRILFDGYWWGSGPHSNREVMKEFILHWAKEFPSDELIVAVRKRHLSAARLELSGGVKVVATRLVPQGLSAILELPLLARKERAQLTLTHNFSPLAGPSLVFIHDMIFKTSPQWFTLKERVYFSLMRLTVGRASVVATSSKSEAARIAAVCGLLEPVLPVGLGVPTSLAKAVPVPVAALANVKGFVLVVGRLNVRKNLAVALAGAVQSQQLAPDRPVVIVGEASGRGAQLPASVQSAVANGTVRFAGFVTDGELVWLYRHAELFMFLSLDEGFGIPTLEALQFGVPILASDIPVFREILGDRATFVDPTSVNRVAEAVRAALQASVGPDNRPSPIDPTALGYGWPDSVLRLREGVKARLHLP